MCAHRDREAAAVIDLVCDARLYDRDINHGDGVHPPDAGYALFDGDIVQGLDVTIT